MTIDFEEPTDFEPIEEEGGSNRLFVILAVGLAGLIVLGLVAIGGVLILRNIKNQQELAQVTPVATPTLAVVEQMPTPTPPPTHTPVPVAPTEPPEPTPTNTPVVQPTQTPTDSEAATATAQAPPATNTPVPVGTPAGGGGDTAQEVPDTGVGGFGLALIALGLVAVLFVSRRMRHAV